MTSTDPHVCPPSCTDAPSSAASTDLCTPLSFSGQVPPLGDYKVRGATLPRMGSGETRGRRGSTGMQRVKEAESEQREGQDKHKNPQGAKGSSRSRQHSGSERIGVISQLICRDRLLEHNNCPVLLSEFGDVFLYSRPSFPSGHPQREADGAGSSGLMPCGDSRTKQK